MLLLETLHKDPRTKATKNLQPLLEKLKKLKQLNTRADYIFVVYIIHFLTGKHNLSTVISTFRISLIQNRKVYYIKDRNINIFFKLLSREWKKQTTNHQTKMKSMSS